MNRKAYFVDNEISIILELSINKRKQLEKKHPNWVNYDCEKNYEQLKEVYTYFKKYGKVIASPTFYNVFVGLTV
jgi:hypothetical protein